MGCCASGPSKEELAKFAVNPPLPKGHPMLAALLAALEAEYGPDGQEGKVGEWLEKLPEFGRGGEAELKDHDSNIEDFSEWVNIVEGAILHGATQLSWLSKVWQVGNLAIVQQPVAGVMPPPVQQPTMVQASPLNVQVQLQAAPPPVMMAQPPVMMAQPPMMMAQPPMMMAQPQAVAMPMGMQPQVVAQPMGMMPQPQAVAMPMGAPMAMAAPAM